MVFCVDAEFRQLLARLDFGLGELAALGLAGVLGLGKAGAELDGGIAVLFLGASADDGAAVEFQDRDGHMRYRLPKTDGSCRPSA